MQSFWEKQHLMRSNIAIIGGGIVGMSVAASILERDPKSRVRIYERSLLPYGASTRNAGFACFGSLTEILSDIDLMGTESARQLIFQRWMGLQITRKRLGDEKIGFVGSGGFELLSKDDQRIDKINEVNVLVEDFLPSYVSKAESLKSYLGIVSEGNLMSMRDEGQVNTGLLIRTLSDYIREMGAEIITGANIDAIDETDYGYALLCKDTFREEIQFEAEKVIICNNAFVRKLRPDIDAHPGRGQVLITKPIDGLLFQGNLHIDEGFYYLRNFENRLLFGGGRNLDFITEATSKNELNESIQAELGLRLKTLFGSEFEFEVEQRWTGIMAFGAQKTPLIKELKPNMFAAVRMSGMGIALAGYIGQELADQLLE
ncbi:MAG: FAD-dependent oxidoreductase [Salibacteraceae bacterium]